MRAQEAVEFLAETSFPKDDESVDSDTHKTTRLTAEVINVHPEMNISKDPPFTCDELMHQKDQTLKSRQGNMALLQTLSGGQWG